MFDKLRRASRLSLADWSLFIEAWVWLFLFDVGLRTRPFPELQAFAGRLAPGPAPSPEKAEKLLYGLRVAVDRARYNHLYPMTCLRRALALKKMLSGNGIPTELRIGIHRDGNQLSAHAWLEYQGRAVGETERITEKFSALEKGVNIHSGANG